MYVQIVSDYELIRECSTNRKDWNTNKWYQSLEWANPKRLVNSTWVFICYCQVLQWHLRYLQYEYPSRTKLNWIFDSFTQNFETNRVVCATSKKLYGLLLTKYRVEKQELQRGVNLVSESIELGTDMLLDCPNSDP